LQRRIVEKQCLIDLSETFEDGGIRRELLADFDESPNDKDAHAHGVGAIQDIGGLQRAVFGEGVWTIPATTV
jgi:hypothetical protein